MVSSKRKLARHYMHSKAFIVDMAAVIPTDLLYLAVGFQSWLRFNRLVRYRRFSEFMDRTETRTTVPNVFRVVKLVLMIFVLFHWNACAYFGLSKSIGVDSDEWAFNYWRVTDPRICTCITGNPYDCIGPAGNYCHWQVVEFSNLTKQYVFSLYWSALILTTIGEQKPPESNLEFMFVIVDILIGLLLFASIIGIIGSMVTNMNAAKADYLDQLDGVKQYMNYRKVVPELKLRIVSWFNYIWSQKQMVDERTLMSTLPTKLRTEIAMAVHLETLKKVNLFRDCEPGLLIELVLKLKLQVYSPMDYLCRKGDIGKEMYIVKRGSIQVVSEDGSVVFVTLKEGSVVGELSILDIPGNKNGNRRTASIRSVGYTDVFVLSKEDLWDALREYRDAKKILLDKGKAMLRKDNLLLDDVDVDPGPETLDKRLDRISRSVSDMITTLDDLFQDYVADSAEMKQRVTAIERIVAERCKEASEKAQEN